MLSKAIFITSLLTSVYAQHIFYDGKTYDFAEKNLLNEIQQYIKDNKSKINKQLNTYKKQAKSKIDTYKPINIKLSIATKTRVFYPDMTYKSEFDIKDQNGNILYPKGFKVNPLKYVTLPYKIIVIDATIPQHIKWLKQQNFLNTTKYKIILSDGNYKDVSKKLKQPVFYLTPKIIERFKLKNTPCIIEQIGQKIEVKEVYIEDSI